MSLEVASEASGREGARHGNYFLSFWTVSTDDIALPDADRYILGSLLVGGSPLVGAATRLHSYVAGLYRPLLSI